MSSDNRSSNHTNKLIKSPRVADKTRRGARDGAEERDRHKMRLVTASETPLQRRKEPVQVGSNE